VISQQPGTDIYIVPDYRNQLGYEILLCLVGWNYVFVDICPLSFHFMLKMGTTRLSEMSADQPTTAVL
jgi:hypothetical protein